MSTSSKPITERIATQGARVKLQRDWGRSFAICAEDAKDLLADPRVPEDVRAKLSVVKDHSREPPTHVLLKPSAFVRLSTALANHAPNPEQPTDRTADVP